MLGDNLYNHRAEVELIGATCTCLEEGLAEGHEAILRVPSDAFNIPRHRKVWEAIKALHSRSIIPDLPNLRSELTSTGIIKSQSDAISLIDFVTQLPMFGSTRMLSEEVMGLYHRREMLKIIGRAQKNASDLMEDPLDVASTLAGDILKISAGNDDDSGVLAGTAMVALANRGAAFRPQGDEGKLAWFGLPSIDGTQDRPIVRASARETVIIAARPGRGKTALTVQTLCSTVMRGVPVMFVSLELGEEEVLARCASYITKTSSSDFYGGHYGESERCALAGVEEIMNRMAVWPRSAGTPWSRIEAAIRSDVMARGTKVVFIDYFGLIGMPDIKTTGSAAGAWAKLSRDIRALGQQLGLCIVLLSQVNREAKDGEPNLGDLRETGGLEQDAQTVLFLFGGKPESGVVDPFKKGQQTDDQEEATYLRIAKNRNGCGKKVHLHFDGAVNTFAEVTRETAAYSPSRRGVA